MKRKWWLWGGLALSALVISLCFYGVRLRVAPRYMLSRAIGTTLIQLEARFSRSPVHLLESVLDPQGRQNVHLQLETEHDHLGIVRYDMAIQTQLNPNRISSQGTVITGGKAVDLTLYLDEDFAAVSSGGLVEGACYGITYDSFSQDIRSRELLAALIGEETISQWEESVSKLDVAMSREISLPEFTPEDVRTALYGVLALKPQVSRVQTSAGATRYAHAVTFQASVQQITQAAESYRDEMPSELMRWLDELSRDPAAVMKAEFLLSKGKLVQIMVELDSTLGYTRIFLGLGMEPGTGQLNMEVMTKAGEDYRNTRLEIDTASDEETYEEKLRITQTQNRTVSELGVDYAYDLSSGELDLKILRDGELSQLRLNLAEEGESLIITTQNISPMLNLFREKPVSPAICTLTIAPGTGVNVPEYRNLDQWSLEDLFTLLTGLGGLLGLKMP